MTIAKQRFTFVDNETVVKVEDFLKVSKNLKHIFYNTEPVFSDGTLIPKDPSDWTGSGNGNDETFVSTPILFGDKSQFLLSLGNELYLALKFLFGEGPILKALYNKIYTVDICSIVNGIPMTSEAGYKPAATMFDTQIARIVAYKGVYDLSKFSLTASGVIELLTNSFLQSSTIPYELNEITKYRDEQTSGGWYKDVWPKPEVYANNVGVEHLSKLTLYRFILYVEGNIALLPTDGTAPENPPVTIPPDVPGGEATATFNTLLTDSLGVLFGKGSPYTARVLGYITSAIDAIVKMVPITKENTSLYLTPYLNTFLSSLSGLPQGVEYSDYCISRIELLSTICKTYHRNRTILPSLHPVELQHIPIWLSNVINTLRDNKASAPPVAEVLIQRILDFEYELKDKMVLLFNNDFSKAEAASENVLKVINLSINLFELDDADVVKITLLFPLKLADLEKAILADKKYMAPFKLFGSVKTIEEAIQPDIFMYLLPDSKTNSLSRIETVLKYMVDQIGVLPSITIDQFTPELVPGSSPIYTELLAFESGLRLALLGMTVDEIATVNKLVVHVTSCVNSAIKIFKLKGGSLVIVKELVAVFVKHLEYLKSWAVDGVLNTGTITYVYDAVSKENLGNINYYFPEAISKTGERLYPEKGLDAISEFLWSVFNNLHSYIVEDAATVPTDNKILAFIKSEFEVTALDLTDNNEELAASLSNAVDNFTTKLMTACNVTEADYSYFSSTTEWKYDFNTYSLRLFTKFKARGDLQFVLPSSTLTTIQKFTTKEVAKLTSIVIPTTATATDRVYTARKEFEKYIDTIDKFIDNPLHTIVIEGEVIPKEPLFIDESVPSTSIIKADLETFSTSVYTALSKLLPTTHDKDVTLLKFYITGYINYVIRVFALLKTTVTTNTVWSISSYKYRGVSNSSVVYTVGTAEESDTLLTIGGTIVDNSAIADVEYATVVDGRLKPVDFNGINITWMGTYSYLANISHLQVIKTSTRVYGIGGHNSTGWSKAIYYAPIQANGRIDTWTLDTIELPVTIGYSSSIVIDSNVYLIGGIVNGVDSDSVYKATIDTNGVLSAFVLEANKLSVKIYGHNVIKTTTSVYVIGGSSYNLFNKEVYIANIEAGGNLSEWVKYNYSLITPIAFAQCQVLGKKAYLIGGYSNGSWSKDVYVSSISESGLLGTWSKDSINSLPDEVSNACSVVVKDRLFLIGGHDGKRTSKNVFSVGFKPDGSLIKESDLAATNIRSRLTSFKTKLTTLTANNNFILSANALSIISDIKKYLVYKVDVTIPSLMTDKTTNEYPVLGLAELDKNLVNLNLLLNNRTSLPTLGTPEPTPAPTPVVTDLVYEQIPVGSPAKLELEKYKLDLKSVMLALCSNNNVIATDLTDYMTSYTNTVIRMFKVTSDHDTLIRLTGRDSNKNILADVVRNLKDELTKTNKINATKTTGIKTFIKKVRDVDMVAMSKEYKETALPMMGLNLILMLPNKIPNFIDDFGYEYLYQYNWLDVNDKLTIVTTPTDSLIKDSIKWLRECLDVYMPKICGVYDSSNQTTTNIITLINIVVREFGLNTTSISTMSNIYTVLSQVKNKISSFIVDVKLITDNGKVAKEGDIKATLIALEDAMKQIPLDAVAYFAFPDTALGDSRTDEKVLEVLNIVRDNLLDKTAYSTTPPKTARYISDQDEATLPVIATKDTYLGTTALADNTLKLNWDTSTIPEAVFSSANVINFTATAQQAITTKDSVPDVIVTDIVALLDSLV